MAAEGHEIKDDRMWNRRFDRGDWSAYAVLKFTSASRMRSSAQQFLEDLAGTPLSDLREILGTSGRC